MGGDTNYLAKMFEHVTVLEMNKSHYDMLVGNMAAIGHKNITFINSDAFTYVEGLAFGMIEGRVIDIIWMDPPWGGKDYKTKDRLDLYLKPATGVNADHRVVDHHDADHYNISNLIALIKKTKLAKYVILKAPMNYNKAALEPFAPIWRELGRNKEGHNTLLFGFMDMAE
jgi:16S rRNA G966 N2-methylase RsmD